MVRLPEKRLFLFCQQAFFKSGFLFYIIFVFTLASVGAQGDGRIQLLPTSEACCYSLSYELDEGDQPFTAFELRLPEGVALSILQIELGEGWLVEELIFSDGYRFYQSNGSALPAMEEELLQICLDADGQELLQMLQFEWFVNSGILARDSSLIECAACHLPFQDSIICKEEGGYDLFLQFINESDYLIDHLNVTELDGMTNVEAASVDLSVPVATGELSEWIPISIASSAEGLDQVCLELTSSRTYGEIFLECCTTQKCITLPVCDRCCDDELDFINDVELGFNVMITGEDQSCDSTVMRVSPLGLSDCDSTRIRRRNILFGAGISLPGRGNEEAIFNAVSGNGGYEICLEVTRQNYDLIDCFETATRMICDTVMVECEPNKVVTRMEQSQLSIFPNPTLGVVSIQLVTVSDKRIATLLTTAGKVVWQDVLPNYSGKYPVDLSDLPAGLYTIVVSDESGLLQYGRILKQ